MSGNMRKDAQLNSKLKNAKSRDLRSKLRSLTETIKNDGEDLADHTTTLLTERVRELDTLSKQVERPSEQVDDSEAFYTLAQRGAEMAKRMAAGKDRSANDFIRHLRAQFADSLDAQEDLILRPSAFKWQELSRLVCMYFRHAPGVSCMLGPLDSAPKARNRVQRVQRKPVGKAVAPELLEAADVKAQEKRETEKNMETMWGILKKHADGIGFLELTLNPKSFSQTVENMFTLAFLVHNTRARLAKSENNNSRGLMVFPHSERAAHKEGKQLAQAHERTQHVMAYTMADWKLWKQYVQEPDCLMPHRAESIEAEQPERGLEQPEEANGSDDEDVPGPSSAPANPLSQPRLQKNSSQAALRKKRAEEPITAPSSNEDEELVQLPKKKGRRSVKLKPQDAA